MKPKGRYTLIKGKFWIHYPDNPRQGPQPDGDTVTFAADDVELVKRLRRFSGRAPKLNASGRIATRFEGIDALETHASGTHQDLTFANAARERNLALLGFRHVVFFPGDPNVVQSVDTNPLPGYVLANGIESNGRLLALVYPGSTPKADGAAVFVDVATLNRSVNAKLVEGGFAYVEPYDTMPMQLVTRLRAIVLAARNANRGLYPAESVTTAKSAQIRNLAELQALVMWPKLFRRLATYFGEGNSGLRAFDAWVRDDLVQRDDTLRLPDGELANLHDTYAIAGNRLQLNYTPESLLIAPDPPPRV